LAAINENSFKQYRLHYREKFTLKVDAISSVKINIFNQNSIA